MYSIDRKDLKRQNIAGHFGKRAVDSSLIMAATTAHRCRPSRTVVSTSLTLWSLGSCPNQCCGLPGWRCRSVYKCALSACTIAMRGGPCLHYSENLRITHENLIAVTRSYNILHLRLTVPILPMYPHGNGQSCIRPYAQLLQLHNRNKIILQVSKIQPPSVLCDCTDKTDRPSLWVHEHLHHLACGTHLHTVI